MHSNVNKTAGIIVVIYNKLCSDSETLASLTDSSAYFVLVLDNSTSEDICRSNGKYCAKHDYKYHSFGSNVGLSMAYNYGISLLDKLTMTVIILDDDTVLPQDYFQQAEQALLSDETSAVLVPLVYANNKLISPCRRTGAIFRRYRSLGSNNKLPAKSSAINSGMIIRLNKINQEFRESGLYDEKLFLDCVDHDFMLNQIENQDLTASTFPAVLQQGFFDTQPKDSFRTEAVARRFTIYANDYRYFCCKNKLGRVIPILYLLFRAIKLSISNQSTLFLSCLRGIYKKQAGN